MSGTHTYAVLEVSKSVWDEIAGLLREAGYDHAFSLDGKTIDMHGIGLEAKPITPQEQLAEIHRKTDEMMADPKFQAASTAEQCEMMLGIPAAADGRKVVIKEVRAAAEGKTMTNLERRAVEFLRMNRRGHPLWHAIPMKVGETICLRPVTAPFGKAGEYEKPIEALEETYDRVVITQEMLDSL